MVSKEEYVKYVEKLLNDDKNKQDMKCLTSGYRIISVLMIVLGVICFCLSIFLLPTIGDLFIGMRALYIGLTVSVLFIVFGVIRCNNYKRVLNHYRDNYREKIIGYLMQGYSFYFESEGWISSSMFEMSQFSKETDCFYSSDVLAIDIPEEDGSKPRADIYIGDVDAYDVSIDEEGNRTTHDVYKGMFGYAQFPYKFKCVLTINSKYKKRGLKLEKVILEEMEFNEIFDVETDNQIEARYILTPDMMEKLKYLQSKIPNVQILFLNNYFFIGAEDVNMFELQKFKNNDEVEVFENLYDEIDMILKIVEEMKNNDKVFVTQKKTRKRKSKKNIAIKDNNREEETADE